MIEAKKYACGPLFPSSSTHILTPPPHPQAAQGAARGRARRRRRREGAREHQGRVRREGGEDSVHLQIALRAHSADVRARIPFSASWSTSSTTRRASCRWRSRSTTVRFVPPAACFPRSLTPLPRSHRFLVEVERRRRSYPVLTRGYVKNGSRYGEGGGSALSSPRDGAPCGCSCPFRCRTRPGCRRPRAACRGRSAAPGPCAPTFACRR